MTSGMLSLRVVLVIVLRLFMALMHDGLFMNIVCVRGRLVSVRVILLV